MKKTFVLFAAIALTFTASGQDYAAEFSSLTQTRDTLAQRMLLEIWEEAEPGDADLYGGYFNYCYIMCRQEIISIDTIPREEQSLPIADSMGNVWYMNSEIVFREQWRDKGMDYIDEGISKHPGRLDLRFGKIHVLGQFEMWGEFTTAILDAINYGESFDHQWTWTNDEDVEDGQDFFLRSLQDYQSQIYNTWNDKLLGYMRTIAARVLEYHPEHIESLSNIAITYIVAGEYDKGLIPLLKAEQIAPTDYIVLGNIAQAYLLKGDNANAALYYEKLLEHGDEQAKSNAREQLEHLKTD